MDAAAFFYFGNDLLSVMVLIVAVERYTVDLDMFSNIHVAHAKTIYG